MSVDLFIGALPFGASSQAVSRFLWDWVVPESVHVVMDRDTGRTKGFGYVVVDGPEDAVAACRASATEMDGRIVVISVARPRVSRVRPMSRVEEYLKLATATPHEVISFSSLQQELLEALRADSSTRDFWVMNSLIRLGLTEEQGSHESMRRKMARLVEVLAENPALMAELDPQLFEHLIAALLTASGYRNVRLTAPSADGGVDIFATKNAGLGRALYIIQCKRYASARKISRPDVQMTFGVFSASPATSAALVTTSSFTKPAQEFIEGQKHKIAGLEG